MTDDQQPYLPGTGVQRLPAPLVRCRQCQRLLHRPESRWERLGPHCATAPDRVRTYDIEQEPLPGTTPGHRTIE
ncbi:DUF6011 domain-containing protein (plasmid) [Kitasatospora sp. NBC_01246]|uniref:DUF6011 domain-containing protein n=1 Tax=Kitasatospora sp. NBC_01246 TaxID=2903570 RepID=UPI002E316E95|nr:DUF6011 domain-containing protein [Kitasatospora sp. NBC_01246]